MAPRSYHPSNLSLIALETMRLLVQKAFYRPLVKFCKKRTYFKNEATAI